MTQRIIKIAILSLVLSCNRRAASPVSQPPHAPPAKVALKSSANTGATTSPTELIATATSAFNAGLALDEEAIYLLTDKVAYRFVPGTPPLQIPIENGGGAAVARNDVVYWQDEAIWKVSKLGGKPRRIASLPTKPQFFMATGEDIAWLAMPVWDQFVIQTLQGNKVRTLLYSKKRIETAIMDSGNIFFVRKEDASNWSIGRLSIRGGDPQFTTSKANPTPAKLAAAGDVFYYDMTSNEIRRLPPDLSKEEVIRKDLICSPITVSTKIYCPNMGGLFELSRTPGALQKPVFPDPRTITNVVANAKYIVWLSDAGPDRLSLMMLPVGMGR